MNTRDLLKRAQQAILCNQKDASMNPDFIVEFWERETQGTVKSAEQALRKAYRAGYNYREELGQMVEFGQCDDKALSEDDYIASITPNNEAMAPQSEQKQDGWTLDRLQIIYNPDNGDLKDPDNPKRMEIMSELNKLCFSVLHQAWEALGLQNKIYFKASWADSEEQFDLLFKRATPQSEVDNGGWISVETAKPENNQLVLTMNVFDEYGLYWWTQYPRQDAMFRDAKGFPPHAVVAKWMQLPLKSPPTAELSKKNRIMED